MAAIQKQAIVQLGVDRKDPFPLSENHLDELNMIPNHTALNSLLLIRKSICFWVPSKSPNRNEPKEHTQLTSSTT